MIQGTQEDKNDCKEKIMRAKEEHIAAARTKQHEEEEDTGK